jgi:hypothetical protein
MKMMFTSTLYALSLPLYQVYMAFAEHIWMESTSTICNSLPKVKGFCDFNDLHLCMPSGIPKSAKSMEGGVDVR